MALSRKYSVLYTHRLITIGEGWYADVQVSKIGSTFNRTALADMLSVKHVWPVDNIVISDNLDFPLSGVPVVASSTGQRLRKLHLEGRSGPWRKDLKVLIRWAPGGLRANDPSTPDFD